MKISNNSRKNRSDIKFDFLNDKKLSTFLVELGFKKLGFRTLVWDIKENLVGVLLRNGSLKKFNDEEVRLVLDGLFKADKNGHIKDTNAK